MGEGRVQVLARTRVCNTCEPLPPPDDISGMLLMYLWQGKRCHLSI